MAPSCRIAAREQCRLRATPGVARGARGASPADAAHGVGRRRRRRAGRRQLVHPQSHRRGRRTGAGPARRRSLARRRARRPTTSSRRGGSSIHSGGSAARRSDVATSASFAAMAYQPRQRRRAPGAGADGRPRAGRTTAASPRRPREIWPGLQDGGAIVDPSLLTAIGAKIGDTLALGEGRFRILGTVINVPGDIGLQMAFGARVFIATRSLPAHQAAGVRLARPVRDLRSAAANDQRADSRARQQQGPADRAGHHSHHRRRPRQPHARPDPARQLPRAGGARGAAARRPRRGERGARVHPPATRHHRRAPLPRRHVVADLRGVSPAVARHGVARIVARRAARRRIAAADALCRARLPAGRRPGVAVAARHPGRYRQRPLDRQRLRAAAAARRARRAAAGDAAPRHGAGRGPDGMHCASPPRSCFPRSVVGLASRAGRLAAARRLRSPAVARGALSSCGSHRWR